MAQVPGRKIRQNHPPEVAAAMTYYACRKFICETFGIKPRKGGSARSSFRLTVESLMTLVDEGNIKIDGKPLGDTSISEDESGVVTDPPMQSRDDFSKNTIVRCMIEIINDIILQPEKYPLKQKNVGSSKQPHYHTTISRKSFIRNVWDILCKNYGLKERRFTIEGRNSSYIWLSSYVKYISGQVGGRKLVQGGSGPKGSIILPWITEEILFDWGS